MTNHIYTCDKVGGRYPQDGQKCSLREELVRRIWATRYLREHEHGKFETDHTPTLVDLAALRAREDTLREALMPLDSDKEPKEAQSHE